jgi:hypothetical protein
MLLQVERTTTGRAGSDYHAVQDVYATTYVVLVAVGREIRMISREQYESILETAGILADRKTKAALAESIRQADRGETIPWEEVKRRQGL